MEPDKKVAFLFPGNDADYREAFKRLKEEEIFIGHLKKIEKGNPGIASQELETQIMIYTICCSICDIYKRQNILPALVSGHSLGIYSCLYAAGAYSFKTGLSILKKAFSLIREFYDERGQRFGMGTIVGFTEDEVQNLLFKEIEGFLEIACFNGERSLVIVGEEKALRECLVRAEALGALKTILFEAELGYHTSFIKGVAQSFHKFLDRCQIFEPRHKILSPLDINLVGKDDIINELTRNLYSPVHWASLIDALVNKHDLREGYEVGPGESLARMTRYINRRLKVYTFKKFPQDFQIIGV